MPKIHIDEQVMAELKRRANGRPPNEVIREFLGLSLDEEQAMEPGVYLIPHSPKEFRRADELRLWLSEVLARNGEYLVASSHYWRNVIPGSVCLFHKDKCIVGEGKMLGGLMSYTGVEISPRTGRRYAGVVRFDPASIEIYKKPIAFVVAEGLLGKTLTFRGVQKLTLKDYKMLRRASK